MGKGGSVLRVTSDGTAHGGGERDCTGRGGRLIVDRPLHRAADLRRPSPVSLSVSMGLTEKTVSAFLVSETSYRANVPYSKQTTHFENLF